MLEIVNQTEFAVALMPFSTPAGIDHAGVVIKGTWDIGAKQLGPSELPQPIAYGDLRHGDGGSVRYAADLGWPKPATDVVLVGHAHTRDPRARQVDVGLKVGALQKVVRVFGERCWFNFVGAWSITEPRPFERMPLVYERAYGGRDTSHQDPKQHAWEARNPIGTGFAARRARERLDGLLLPNLENPRQLIQSWSDRPAPAGFGFTEGFWAPRADFAGTYDAAWREHRAPLLPQDFDTRFLNAATPELIARGHLLGGEDVAITNASERGLVRFRLPHKHVTVAAELKGKLQMLEPKLDTVWIDTDAHQLVLVWRAAIACPRSLLGIRVVFVKAAA